jgi:hypothetical protein
MTVTVSPVYLLDIAADAAVDAELRDAIEEAQLADWEALWKPSLEEAIRRLHAQKVPRNRWPQSRHWDWRDKIRAIERLLAHQTFCIVCKGQTQGLMAVNLTIPTRIREQRGKPMVYVEYLESAPWNRPELFSPHRYRGVGKILMRAAIECSLQEEFKGRVGLHSLPQADEFYRDKCGMTDLGTDAAKQDLRYFEMTPEQALLFIQKGGK